MILYPQEAPGRVAGALRWGAAGLLVLILHAGAGWWLFAHPFAAETRPDTVEGVQIDLKPVAVPQNAAQPSETLAAGPTTAPQSSTAPTPQPETPPIQPATPPEKTEPPTPDPQPQPQPTPAPAVADAQPDPPPEQKPELMPPPDPPVEEPKPAPSPPSDPPPVTSPEQKPVSDAVLAPPPPPPPKVVRPKPDPRKLAREAAERKALADRREQRRAARAAQAAETQQGGGQAFQAAAPSSASSGESISSWRGEVMARLNAAKPASANGASGISRVAFSLDRGGRVLSAGIAQSSGDGTLDEAAVSMVRRASPLPAPPPELGERVSLSVPVRFRWWLRASTSKVRPSNEGAARSSSGRCRVTPQP